MDWIKSVQDVVPWVAGLPVFPKSIFSALILGVSAFILVLIWTPPPEDAVKAILSQCYRRAMFTVMHAQLNQKAMFVSIDECREVVQEKIPKIRSKYLQEKAIGLLAALEELVRNRGASSENAERVNKLKLTALHLFRDLAVSTGDSFPLPADGKLGTALYFTQKQADAPLSGNDLNNQILVDPNTGEIRTSLIK